MVNFIDDYSGSFFYSVPQSRYIDPTQNYLTDVGAYSDSSSYYGAYGRTGGGKSACPVRRGGRRPRRG